MMWYPGKSVFRIGMVTGTQWNDDNVGNFSFTVGGNPIASGHSSTEIGRNTLAPSAYETVIGR